MKTSLLTALTSVKRVGDLQALSVDDTSLEFRPVDSHMVVRPWRGYVAKVHTTHFRDQMITLQAFPPDKGDPALSLLSSVHFAHLSG